MKTSHLSRRLRVQIETRRCALRRGELDSIDDSLSILDSVIAGFPFADLHATVSYRPRCEEYHVKTRLTLPGRALFTGEHDAVVLPAYERCLRKLSWKIGRQQALHRQANSNRGSEQSPALQTESNERVHRTKKESIARPIRFPATGDIGDYLQFRKEMQDFEELVRERVIRWVARYSESTAEFINACAAAEMKQPFDDLAEEVFLTAYERAAAKPKAMRLNDWIESLIDPAMRSFLRHPDEDLEAIGFARTLQEMYEDQLANDDEGIFEPDSDEVARRANALFRRPR